MAGQWTKLTVRGKVDDLELITSIMSMLDNGLMIEDYSDFSFRGMYGELVDEEILHADMTTVKVSLFVPMEKNLAEYTSFLKERFAFAKIETEITLEGVNEDDWAESWKQYYKPVPLGRITIVPAWEEYTPKEGEVIVRMDPGMAFGTGTHETTRLVVLLMQDLPIAGKRVLDVGTGSGILSICASKLGAKDCHGYDIDPVAVKVAAENAKSDGCDNITVGVSDLLKDVDLSEGKYDFCVANIVADIILRMLPDMMTYLKPSAPLILSGIIEPRADEVRHALAEHGFRIVKEQKENDWVGIYAVHD
ncbi:MAG: 50S ribosomal protein L11 methyltransferase [Clostridia bacterium]|nr:50S ribosomal protein L11 methyltransferase [Clostridia bacterium]